MKPLNRTEQSQRTLRWIKYGSLVGFVLALLRMIALDGDASFSWAEADALGLSAFNFALIIFVAGAIGGMLAILTNWKKSK